MPPSSPRPSPSRRRKGPDRRAQPERPDRPASPRTPFLLLIGAALFFVVAAAIGTWITVRSWAADRPARLLAEARAATDAGDLPRALAAWHAWNDTKDRTPATLLVEAQLAGDLHRGRDAVGLAQQVTRSDPTAATAWVIQLNRLRVLDQAIEAMELGLAALNEIRRVATDLRTPASRTFETGRAILKETTLATLAEVPDAEARDLLDRWIAADPGDIEARVARLSRMAANPHPGDPDRATRIIELQAIVARDPRLSAAREALAVALADAGEVERGQTVLDAWPRAVMDPIASPGSPPSSGRGYRFDRLQARWNLDFNHRPDRAAEGFRQALTMSPHDWKSHYGLARALRTLGQPEAANAEALAVARLRERLDPATLGPRLTSDLAGIDAEAPAAATQAMLDLAELCRGVGLTRLAAAWTRLASEATPPTDRGLGIPAL